MFQRNAAVALVTGAGAADGIGFATATALAAMGASVYLTGASDRVIKRAAELQALGYKASASVADLTDESQVAQLMADVRKTFGSLDIVVNNAGMTSVSNPSETTGEAHGIEHLSLAGWNMSLDRNLTTAFLVTKAALPLLRSSAAGRVVMVSSVTGAVMAMRNDVAYSAAKAGMLGMTRALALDEAEYGITVNSVSPGWIATGSQTEHEVAQGLSTAVGRSGTALEVGATIAWLCSIEAAYVTGQNIVVDGGNSIAEERG